MKIKKYIRGAAVGAAACVIGYAITMGAGLTYLYLNENPKKPQLETIVMGEKDVAKESNPLNPNENQGNYSPKTALKTNLEKKLKETHIKPKKKNKENKKFRDINTVKNTANKEKYTKPDISYNINADHAVVVNKRDQTAYLFDLGNINLEKEYIVSTAKKSGPKRVIGDNKTPEGFFKVTGVKKKDGAIGPYAVYYDYVFSEDKINNGVLGTPFHGIKSFNLGKPASHGCIRFSRGDIVDLIKYINKNDFILIYDGPEKPKEILAKELKRLN